VLQPAHALLSWATSLIRVIRGQASSGNQIREAPVQRTGPRT